MVLRLMPPHMGQSEFGIDCQIGCCQPAAPAWSQQVTLSCSPAGMGSSQPLSARGRAPSTQGHSSSGGAASASSSTSSQQGQGTAASSKGATSCNVPSSSSGTSSSQQIGRQAASQGSGAAASGQSRGVSRTMQSPVSRAIAGLMGSKLHLFARLCMWLWLWHKTELAQQGKGRWHRVQAVSLV